MKKQKIQWKRSKFKWFFWWALAPNHTHTLNILHGFISFSWLLQNRLPVWLTGWLLACDVVIKVWQSRPPIKFNSHAIHTHTQTLNRRRRRRKNESEPHKLHYIFYFSASDTTCSRSLRLQLWDCVYVYFGLVSPFFPLFGRRCCA